MAEQTQAETRSTDPTGKCFVSYRRSCLPDVEKIVDAMLDLGVPPWQDRRDLTSQPLAAALRTALDAPDTAGALLWISEDVDQSPAILEIEAPRMLARARRDPAFFAELWLAGGLDYARAAEVFRPAGMVDNIAAAWHLERARTTSLTTTVDGESSTTRQGIDDAEAMRIAARLLARRLQKVHECLPAGQPLRILFNAHAEANEGFVPGFAVQINWSRHFAHRFAPPAVWEGRLLPALDMVARAARAAAPRRPVLGEGRATLTACLALGRAFREVGDIPFGWVQKPSGATWRLSEGSTDSGFCVEALRDQRLGARDLGIFVSVTGDVEPAVRATPELPPFRAVVSVRPGDGSVRRDLGTAGEAAHLARLVADAVRTARHELKVIERTHLFLAGPNGLAVLLGQQLNALGPVQTYEHLQTPQDGVGRYVAAALLTDPNPAC